MTLMNGIRILFLFSSFFAANVFGQQLVVGTINSDPPFEFQDESNNLSGFDIDIMHELCKRTGNECAFKTFKFHQLFEALEQGEIDLAIAAIVITPERRKQLLFSLPYKGNHQQFFTLSSSDLKDPAQLRDKTIGIYKGAPEEEFVSTLFNKHINIKLYESVNDLLDALKSKQVDAIVLEYHRARYWLSSTSGFKLLGHEFRAGEGYGIAARLGSEHLIQQINSELERMESDGTYLHIYDLYF